MSGFWRHIYHVITCVTNELKGSAAGDIINHSAHQVEGTSCASSQNWDLTRKTLSDFCCFRFSSFADAIRAKIMESYPITRSRFLNYAKVFNGILCLRWGELSEGTGMWIIRTINHVLGKEKNEKCEAKKIQFFISCCHPHTHPSARLSSIYSTFFYGLDRLSHGIANCRHT